MTLQEQALTLLAQLQTGGMGKREMQAEIRARRLESEDTEEQAVLMHAQVILKQPGLPIS